MDLRAMMARHARTSLTRLDHHGEEITYTPAGGEPRTVRAVVNRRDLQPIDPNVTRVARLFAIVTLPRDAEVGVLAVAPGDTLLLPMRLGEAPVVARVLEIVYQDDGATEVTVGT
jgi:hypothetical protein